MKKLLLILLYSTFVIHHSAFSQPPGEWTWMHGSNTVNVSGTFGTQGISSPLNNPPSFYEPVEWTDAQGNFWLYGGYSSGAPTGSYGDMWKYDPTINEWTWIHGTGLPTPAPVYGTMGISSPLNSPGANAWCAATWVDMNGKFWLFGGSDAGGGSWSVMWMYDPLINEWTWMNGPTAGGSPGVFGVQGVSSPANYPPSRWETNAAWVDAANNLWLYGGYGGLCSDDLWKYSTITNEWTWMNGSAAFVAPSWGTLGVSSSANTPGQRQVYSKWNDASGDLWMFGGSGEYNDMWKYTLSSNEWTWMGGTNLINDAGIYSSLCNSSVTNLPSARHENRACWTDANGNFWFFSGYTGSVYNDLWKYCPVSGKWTWVNGPQAANGAGVYGTLGVSSPTNIPGARMGSAGWKDLSGNFWIFGGYVGVGPTGNDLWRYVPDPNCGDNACSAAPPVVNFVASDRHICPGSCIDFTNFSIGATSYQWYFNGASPSTSTDVNPTLICYNTPGIYNVTLVATNSFGSDSVTLANLIEVYPQPALPVVTQIGNDLHATGGYFTYQWFYVSDTIAGATDSIYTATQNGNYNLVVTDTNGCAVGVGILNVVVEPDGLTPTLSKGEGVAVYPNPASEKLYVTCYMLYSGEFNVEIYNTLGEKVYSRNYELRTTNYELKIPLKDFTDGIYIVCIRMGGDLVSRKFVVER